MELIGAVEDATKAFDKCGASKCKHLRAAHYTTKTKLDEEYDAKQKALLDRFVKKELPVDQYTKAERDEAQSDANL